MAELLNFTVDFGEADLAFAAALVVALWLGLTGQGRWLAAWIGTIIFVIGVTVVLRTPTIWPSGHVAVSSAFYGGLAVVVWRSAPDPVPRWTIAIVALLVMFPVAITTAILIMAWHGLRGVSLGFALGGITPLVMARLPKEHAAASHLAPMLIATAIVLAALHGSRMDYTHMLAGAEAWWQRSLP